MGSTIAAVAGMKKVAGTRWRSSTSSTRGSPRRAPNSPPVSTSTVMSARAKLLAELFSVKVRATAMRAPAGQRFGVSLRPARTARANRSSWSSGHSRPGCVFSCVAPCCGCWAATIAKSIATHMLAMETRYPIIVLTCAPEGYWDESAACFTYRATSAAVANQTPGLDFI